MSKKAQRFEYKEHEKLPILRRPKDKWDLKNHYYASEKDPQIEKDIRKAEQAYAVFAKKYKNKKFTATAKSLSLALCDQRKLSESTCSVKPILYFWLRVTLNSADETAHKKINLIESRLSKAGNQILFFGLAIAKISTRDQKKFLADPLLADFRYDLEHTFDNAKYLLSEPEEKILNLKSEVSSGMWVSGTEKILNKKQVVYKGESIPLPAAVDRVQTVSPKEKPKLWKLVTDEFEKIAEVAENELNAIVTNKKINDELRGYKHPYTATIKGYENNEKSVLALVDVITNKGFALSKKFYRLKARYQNVKQIGYANRTDSIGKEIELSYETAVSICRDTFYSMKSTYGEIFDHMLKTGAIDVYPKQGKGGGAFCMHQINLPTFVMLNQVHNTSSFTTLAHEMGHAIHSERSKNQPSQYQNYSTTTAETASTLFEGLAFKRFVDQLDNKSKLSVLHDKISDTIATICRQIAFFNYEKELHETVRTEGAMSWQEMAKLLQKHMQAYMGNAVSITEADGLTFVYVSHFRRFFYVYSYAYGELVSNIMADRYLNDPSYIEKIDSFLCAGGSDTVEHIFKTIGIDTMKTETFLESLSSLESDIVEFEKLTHS